MQCIKSAIQRKMYRIQKKVMMASTDNDKIFLIKSYNTSNTCKQTEKCSHSKFSKAKKTAVYKVTCNQRSSLYTGKCHK